MKLFFSYKRNEVIWPDYINDFLESSTPVDFIEHRNSGFGLGTYHYAPTDNEDSNLRDYCGDIYTLVDVDEYDDGLLMIDGEVYEERDGLAYAVEED